MIVLASKSKRAVLSEVILAIDTSEEDGESDRRCRTDGRGKSTSAGAGSMLFLPSSSVGASTIPHRREMLCNLALQASLTRF